MDPWQRIESLSRELKYMDDNLKRYRQSLKVAKEEKEVCRVQTKASPLFFFVFFFGPLFDPREVLQERLSQAHIALDAHIKLGAKYRERLAAYEDPSASRPSHLMKRPLPVGIVQHPEAKTKKLASNELPRPSRAPEP